MNAFRLPRLYLTPTSQLGEDSWHSILISLMRGLAALQVAAAHLRAEFYPSLRTLDNPTLWYQALAFFTGFAHQAVLVFFLISGWLVGGSFLNKMGQPGAARLYAIDRLTRLWTVLVPTFALILAFGIVTGTLDPGSVDFAADNAYSVTALAGNLAGVQKILVPVFGGNYPLWSLANETWYYIMFPLLLMSFGGGRRVLPAVVLALCAILLPAVLVLYFSIWLLGAACSRVRIECGAFTRAGLLAALLGVSVWFRLYGSNDEMVFESFPQDLLISVLFMAFLCTTIERPAAGSTTAGPLKRGGTFLSNFSFTLYVVHIPVLWMFHWLGQQLFGATRYGAQSLADLCIYTALLAAVTVFSYGFYLLFEARTYQIRKWAKAWLGPRTDSAAAAAPSK